MIQAAHPNNLRGKVCGGSNYNLSPCHLFATCSHIRISTKVILDGLKRNMSRGNSLSDELEPSSVLGDARAYLYSPVWG